MNNKIICVVGMAGSGKSEAADELARQGFIYLRFGQITLDKIKEKGLSPTAENERKVREGIRKKYGMAAFAVLNISKIDKLVNKFNIVIDGLYSWSEYKVLKDKYGKKLITLVIYAPPETRYVRLENRKKKNDKDQRFRSFTKKEAKARDYAEIENIEKGGPIAMADFTIINTGTKKELKQSVRNILEKLKL